MSLHAHAGCSAACVASAAACLHASVHTDRQFACKCCKEANKHAVLIARNLTQGLYWLRVHHKLGHRTHCNTCDIHVWPAAAALLPSGMVRFISQCCAAAWSLRHQSWCTAQLSRLALMVCGNRRLVFVCRDAAAPAPERSSRFAPPERAVELSAWAQVGDVERRSVATVQCGVCRMSLVVKSEAGLLRTTVCGGVRPS